ncbi:MAG: hypothetical protein AMJ79_04110 [Phycisphaerae bacterium SM23_30]|nr:MAG: hypothetical protein AMJ79_04110 [Phycisphaerae bacterium SM23_30]
MIGAGRRVCLLNDEGWEYVERLNISGIVCIVAVTEDGNIVLTQQFRRPVGKEVIELPAGLAGDEAGQERETLAEAAQRELREETGYQGREMIFLTEGPPSSGLTSEIITFFLARGIKKVAPGGGRGRENIKVHEISLSQVHNWLQLTAKDGNILVDPKVYTGLYFALQHRVLS